MVQERRDDKKCTKIVVDKKIKTESETYEKGLKKRRNPKSIEPTMDVQLAKSENQIDRLNYSWKSAN